MVVLLEILQLLLLRFDKVLLLCFVRRFPLTCFVLEFVPFGLKALRHLKKFSLECFDSLPELLL